MSRLILMMVVVLGITSCFNETAYRTNLIVQPYTEVESGDDMEPLDGVTAYAFSGTLDDWEISSIEDALSGYATSITTGESLEAFVMATPSGESTTNIEMLVDREEIFVVVADPITQIYAYSDYLIPINLGELYLTVVFREWKSASYTSGTWTFIIPESEEDEEEIEDEEADEEEEVEDDDEETSDEDELI